MSLADTLTKLSNARGALVAALNSKGAAIASSATLYECADGIDSLSLGGTDVSSTTADAGDVLSGKIFYNSGGTLTSGTIPSISAATITPTTSAQTISAGNYLSGTQTIKGDANLVASNIVSGVSIFGVSGTYTGSSGGAEVTLGYITSSGDFQPLVFSGVIPENSESAVTLPCYTWLIPSSGGSSGGSSSGSSGVIITSGNVSSGIVVVSSATSVSNVYLQPRMHMTVYSGGTATNIYENGGSIGGVGYYTIHSNTFTNKTIEGFNIGATQYAFEATVHSGTIASDNNINSFGGMRIYSGGIASSNTVNYAGHLYVSSGGTATATTVNSHGEMFVSSGGTATDTIVSSGGSMVIYSGAVTSNITSMTGAVIINS